MELQHKMTLIRAVRDQPVEALETVPSPAQASLGGEAIEFGPIRVIPSARRLLVNGQAVEMGSRTFDLLMVLVRARGTVVAKDVIVAQVWPAMVVDESNLRFQVAELRRALGLDRDLVKTVSGRGYILAVGDGSYERGAGGEVAPPRSRSSALVDSLATNARQTPATIFIVDDDGPLRDAIGNFLRTLGLRVEVFPSLEAYETLVERRRALPAGEDAHDPGFSSATDRRG